MTRAANDQSRQVRREDMVADDWHAALRDLNASLRRAKLNAAGSSAARVVASSCDHKIDALKTLDSLACDHARRRIGGKG